MTKFHIPEFYVQARKFKTPVFSFAKKAYRTFCRNYLLCCTEYGRTAHEAFFFRRMHLKIPVKMPLLLT